MVTHLHPSLFFSIHKKQLSIHKKRGTENTETNSLPLYLVLLINYEFMNLF